MMTSSQPETPKFATPEQMPILRPLPGGGWVLMADWTYQDITVPAGFITDLDSVPRIPGIYALFKGWARASALLHDWLYKTGQLARKLADKLLYEVALWEKVPVKYAKPIYIAVRCFGASRYNVQA